MDWISVRDWRKFQHYDPTKRQPPWIKVYNELLDSDDYGGLTLRQRGILHGLWMAYARSGCGLRASRVGLMIGDDSVKKRDLDALNHAGYIDFVASKTLAEGYHDASTLARARAEAETEKEVEEETNPKAVSSTYTTDVEHAETNGPGLAKVEDLKAQVAAAWKDL